MPDIPLNLAEIEERIAAVREYLTELEEQAAAYSGGAVEELNAQRIADQEAQLERLMNQRDELLQRKPRPELRITIKQHREVIGGEGVNIGTVARVAHGRFRLIKATSGAGRHKD